MFDRPMPVESEAELNENSNNLYEQRGSFIPNDCRDAAVDFAELELENLAREAVYGADDDGWDGYDDFDDDDDDDDC